jgi:hypothetical protein
MSTKHSLVAVCAAVLLFVGFVTMSRAYVVHRAKELITDVQGLDKARDPTAAALSFTKKYHRYLQETPCDHEVCQYRFVFTNRPVSILHVAKQAQIEALVTVYGAQLDFVGLSLTSSVFKENSPIVYVQEDFCKDRTDIKCDHFAINPHGRYVRPIWNGIVEFGQVASDEQKQLAWSLKTDCMTAPHGCSDISEIMPELWKRVSPDSVSSRVRSTADSIAEGAQPLPDSVDEPF